MKRLLITIFAIILLLSPVFVANGIKAEDEEPITEEPQNSDNEEFTIPPLTYIEEEVDVEDLKHDDSLELNRTTNLPSRYSLVDDGYVTSVKNQGSYGTCWTFAACASAESTYLKETGTTLDLSELHLAYYGFHSYQKSDSLNLITNDGNQATDYSALTDDEDLLESYEIGGNSFIATCMLSSGIGFVTESTLDYSNAAYMNSLSITNCYQEQYTLKEVRRYSMDRDERDYVKEAIMNYGAMEASFYFDSDPTYYSYVYNSYNNNGHLDSNHAITIVGWDDNYSRNNFVTVPTLDGAWICKNSWGTSWGDNGYFYISYADTSLNNSNRVAYQFFIEPADNDVRTYQYDGSSDFAYSYSALYNPNGQFQCNIYTSSRSNEFLKSVSFWTMLADEDVTIKIYTGTRTPEYVYGLQIGTLAHTETLHVSETGYHKVDLSSEVQLTEGEKYSVVIQHTKSDNNSKILIEVCDTISRGSFTSYSSNSSFKSYYSTNGYDWEDYRNDGCARIKAFTVTCNHDYDLNNAVWDWSEDYSSANMVLTCQTNNNHTLSLPASIVTEVITAPSKTAVGIITHEATVVYEDVTYTNMQTEYIPMIESDDQVIGEYSSGNFTYTLFGDYSLLVEGTGCFNSSVPSAIPETYRDNITKVTLSEGFTSIDTGAFSNLANLTSYVFPSTLQTIGASIITDDITSIVFEGSRSQWYLIDIDEGSDIDALLAVVFHSFDITYELDGGNGNENNPLIYNFSRDGEITLSDSSKRRYLFRGWYLDEEFETPITTLNEDIDEDITIYAKFEIDEDYYWQYADKNVTDFVVEEGVTSIPASAFKNNHTIRSISLPSSLINIGQEAFYGCTSLASVSVQSQGSSSDQAGSIGARAFSGCTSLTTVVLPDFITSIGEYAFNGCTSLTTIQLPSQLSILGNRAFQSCSSLETISLPSSLTSMGDGTFFSCTSLTSIQIPSQVSYIGELAFTNCNSLETVGLPSSLTSINASAFLNCYSLASIQIPSQLTSIGTYVFGNCRSLETVNFSESLTSIGDEAFYGCSSLTSIHIPESVTSIGDSAFRKCTSLESITVDEDNSTYDSRDNCNAIVKTSTNCIEFGCKNTTIPSTVTGIGDYALADGYASGALVIPNTITSIEAYAFFDCDELSEVTISDSVTAINEFTFFSCDTLEKIYIPSSVTAIYGCAFQDCVALKTIYIPSSVTMMQGNRAYNSNFIGCSNHLTIYTGVSSKPQEWGSHWSYVSSTTSATVIWGITYEDYLDSLLKKYSVSFDGNGAKGTMPDQIINETEGIPEPTFTRKGYEFTGWNTSQDGTGVSLDAGQNIGLDFETTTFTLYAQWQLIDYNISLDSDGGVLAKKQSYGTLTDEDEDGIYTGTYTIYSSEFKLPTLTKNYYTFKGWYDLNNKKVTTIAKGSVGDKEYTALYKPITYKITYNAMSGKLVTLNSKSPQYNATYNADFTSLDLPSADENEIRRTGYTFDGWYLSYNSKTKEYDRKIESLEDLAAYGYKNITLYAKWSPIHYSIRYTNEANEEVTVPDIAYGTSYKLNKDIFTKPGYYVSKWTYMDTKGKNVTVEGSASVKNLTATDGAVIEVSVAKSKGEELWSTATYTITYNLNGGTQNSKNKKSYTVNTASFLLLNPTRKGYAFEGWYEDGEFTSEAVTSINPGIEGDYGNRVYYAKWSLIPYSITFNPNEGTLPSGYEEETISYTVEDTVTLPVPTRANYTFAGWYKGTTKVTSIKKGTINDMALTAKWTEGTNYTIVYDRNNDSATGKMSNTKVTAGKNVTLTSLAYKLTGKVFVEWNTEPGGTGISFKNKATILKSNPLSAYGNESITLYAIWDDEKSFTIQYDANEGTGTMKNQSMKNSAYKALTANTFKRAGYTFTGWNTAADGSGISYKNKETFSAYRGNDEGNVTLYAQWDLNTYKITYKNMKSTDTNLNPVSYTVLNEEDIELVIPTRNNYLCLGWYSDSSYKKKVETIRISELKNKTLYAKWVAAAEIMDVDAYSSYIPSGSTYSQTKTSMKNYLGKFKNLTIQSVTADDPSKAGSIESITVNGVKNTYVGGLYPTSTTKIIVKIYK